MQALTPSGREKELSGGYITPRVIYRNHVVCCSPSEENAATAQGKYERKELRTALGWTASLRVGDRFRRDVDSIGSFSHCEASEEKKRKK